jgi:uncharacterized membrane protein
MINNAQPLPNAGRQQELDFARGLAVVFMIAVHVLETFGTSSLAESWLGYTIELLGGPPAAPIFMFLLGVGIAYSSKATPLRLAQRGLLLLTSAYLLNFLRGGLPVLLTIWLGWEVMTINDFYEQMFLIDILHFAGLAFLFFSAWKVLRVQHRWLLLIPILSFFAQIIISLFIADNASSSVFYQALSGLIWGSSSISYFPFISWISYPALGLFFGYKLIHTTDKSRFYTLVVLLGLGLVSVALLIGLAGFGVDMGLYDEYAYYHHGLFGTIAFSGFNLLWLGVLFTFSASIEKLFGRALHRWSRNVGVIYFVHWVILGWSLFIIEENSMNGIRVIFFIIALVAVSDLISSLWVNRHFLKGQ